MRFKRRVGKERYLPTVSALSVTVLVTYLSFVQFGAALVRTGRHLHYIQICLCSAVLKPKVGI